MPPFCGETDKPLFLHFAHHAPHIPNITPAEFSGTSWSAYGDAVQELDWSVGQVMATLKDTGRDQNAIVLFLSDNGPEGTGPERQKYIGANATDARQGYGTYYSVGSTGGMRSASLWRKRR